MAIGLYDAIKERMDTIAYEAMAGTALTATESTEFTEHVMAEPSVKEQDFDCLRDFLVDMCSATLPKSPPSQKEWDEIRERAKAAAVEHALHNREEKKAVKKSGGRESIGRKSVHLPPRSGKSSLLVNPSQAGSVMTASMLSGTQLAGTSANLLIIDDPVKGA